MTTKSIKRTFSIPKETLETLDQLIPKTTRSRFVSMAIIKELQQKGKEEALKVLENMEKFKLSSDEIIKTIRQIREEESARLNLNH